MYLTETPHEIVLSNNGTELVFSRQTGDCFTRPSTTYQPRRSVTGLLGVLDLPFSKYLVLAKSAVDAGLYLEEPVQKVTEIEILALWETAGKDDEYLSLARSHFNSAPLFFLANNELPFDLTVNAQRRQAGINSDDRFLWNYELSKDLPSQFVLRCIYGVFTAHDCGLQLGRCTFGLVTRRSRFRAGTRYFRRGVDSEGNAANFNETEQLLVLDKENYYSFVQTRGSVPGVWSEINNLKYKPQLEVGSLNESCDYAERHFAEQKSMYGNQFLVNLVNHSGYELPVKQLYEDVVHNLRDPALQYVYFDFHSECSKMRWERVSLLLEKLDTLGLQNEKYFVLKNGKVESQQSGVVRTNCMDCLDRTNVVQSAIAFRVIEQQLRDAHLLPETHRLELFTNFVSIFRNVWADNADGVSNAYSGTGALKTDFTRTGKRTEKGAFQDFVNSAVRYFKNNFFDGSRQDGFTLVLGEYKPTANRRPFVDRRPLIIQSVPYFMSGTFLVFVLSVVYPSRDHSTLFNSVVSFTFAALAALSLSFIKHNGMQYVNWPKLAPVRFVEWVNNEYVIHKNTEPLDSKRK